MKREIRKCECLFGTLKLLRRGLKGLTLIVLCLMMSIYMCSCKKNDESTNTLPKGVEYFTPTWFESLLQYGRNWNRISEFTNGYASIEFRQYEENWNFTNERHLIINEKGEVVLGPLEGDFTIGIPNKDTFGIETFYIEDNETETSKITDVAGNTLNSYDGALMWKGEFNKNGLSVIGTQHIISHNPYQTRWTWGLVEKEGQVIVPCEYLEVITDIEDDYIVFISDENLKNAVVFNPNGTFSHNLCLDEHILGYENGMLIISDNQGYQGLADIYGNVIVAPVDGSFRDVSENYFFFVSGKSSKLVDCDGNTILSYDTYCDSTDMYNDTFLLSYNGNSYLMTSKGKTIEEYEGAKNPKYCGDGVFSIEYGEYHDSYTRLIDGKSGEFIKGEYSELDTEIKFNSGYAVVKDTEGSKYIIDKKGNKYCEEYDVFGTVYDCRVMVRNDNTVGIIYLPEK